MHDQPRVRVYRTAVVFKVVRLVVPTSTMRVPELAITSGTRKVAADLDKFATRHDRLTVTGEHCQNKQARRRRSCSRPVHLQRQSNPSTTTRLALLVYRASRSQRRTRACKNELASIDRFARGYDSGARPRFVCSNTPVALITLLMPV